MKKARYFALAAIACIALPAVVVLAHCQIPCGIYDDPARFTLMNEHVQTIQKSMQQIEELEQAEEPNYNQIVRWVNNKDQHADELSEIATYYFLAQRVKPVGDDASPAAREKYVKELTLLHGIVVNAMKAKQTTDLQYCEKLYDQIAQFEKIYLGESAAAAPVTDHATEHAVDHSHLHDAGTAHDHQH